MTPKEFSFGIITPVLESMDMYSHSAHDLLLGTAITESGLKTVVQNGYDFLQPDQRLAHGYYQMEPATLWDLYDSWLYFNNEKRALINMYKSHGLSKVQNLIANSAYATAAARLQYYRFPEELPDTIEGQAAYWKKYWNTEYGAGTVEKYIEDVAPFIEHFRC